METAHVQHTNFQMVNVSFFCPLVSGTMTLDVPELRQISKDLSEMNSYLTILRKEDHLQNQWCHVGYILDFLLFRIYLLMITGYALVIICMWCIWMKQQKKYRRKIMFKYIFLCFPLEHVITQRQQHNNDSKTV